ncbi:uncharacterized protein LOC129306954 [Prosopis cineraria]|uniref:uncharacterized protein LOC129306934 n=1 Tax=Prosopis cineraria TaxID=364024 RepID=UPI0024105425|nr:uncharacterized protein LOC129306934 [Prosopis cineraria]XP_054803755.1 uncharacterized protein LOC129306954 [Prosopis cineraria]
MKPHPVSGEASRPNDSAKSIGDKLRQVYQAAVVAVTADSLKQPRLLLRNQTERRGRSHRASADDPIRTLMFLGSWSHT